MKIVTVNGISYLGAIEKTDEGITLTEAMPIGGPAVTKAEVEAYYKKGNLGELKTVTFGGAGISFSEVGLSDDVVMFCKMAELVMEQAKKVAVKKLENGEFTNGLGGVGRDGDGNGSGWSTY